MGKMLQWLKRQVDCVIFDEKKFRIPLGEDSYIFGAIINRSNSEDKPDFFALSSIYDTIIDLINKIKYSFYQAYECNPSESFDVHELIGKPQSNELLAVYFIENMVFRTEILWDLLAHFYNELWLVHKPIKKIYAELFFKEMVRDNYQKDKSMIICSYLNQDDYIKEECEPWYGNHKYIKKYRNQMAHRNSPNISTMSSFSMELRPPASFVLKRVTEDFLKVVEFIQNALDEASVAFNGFVLFTPVE